MKIIRFTFFAKGLYSVLASAILFSCTAPRAIIHSGKVTPLHEITGGVNYSANISTTTVGAVYNGLKSVSESYLNKDTIVLDDQLNNINKSAMAYALDPIGAGMDLYLRYGIATRFDIGYKYAAGVHVFDGRYQFMGSTGSMNNPGEKGLYGSIGLQYSSKKYEFPFSSLDKLMDYLGFSFKRKDILIPLVFSKSFGEEEKIGHFAFGVAYNHTFMEYGFEPKSVYVATAVGATPQLLDAIQDKKNFGSIGGFVNAKFGYKYIYFLVSCSVYYQNYGTFKMLGGETAHYSGVTVVPTYGLQFHIPMGKKSNSTKNKKS